MTGILDSLSFFPVTNPATSAHLEQVTSSSGSVMKVLSLQYRHMQDT
ncbi:hypothetical protein Mpsy_0565 [Methanolobus psychrophilus R15]|nr:hypothetical protein Mpsy_0565 [Methanolobus psychrophilus R15]